MRRNPIGFALTVGMALIVVLFGFTLLSAAELAGFSAADAEAARNNTGGTKAAEGPKYVVAKADKPAPLLSGPEAAAVAAGDALFNGNCAQCHAVNEQVVGPALAGISKRRPISWLIPWVKNSSKVVASGDDYAVALNKQQMPSFALSDKEIVSIMAYVNSQQGQSRPVAYNNTTVTCE